MAVDLPEDALIEVLARLPVESLVRFVCVCKSWYALIKSHNFITTHHNYTSSNDNASRIVVIHPGNDFKYITSVLSNDGVEIYHDIPNSFVSGVNPHAGNSFKLSSSCNGVICVCDYHGFVAKRVALWNPATREINNLVLDDGIAIHKDYREIYSLIGFGLNAKSNVYKVVRCRQFSNIGLLDESLDEYVAVDIYDVGNNNSNESWRKIDATDLPLTGYHHGSVYADGFCYWSLNTMEDFQGVISFDFINEVFEMMPMPSGAIDKGLFSMATLGDSVAFVANSLDHDCRIVWVLSREGDKKTWIREFALPIQYRSCPRFLTSGKILMVVRNQLNLYELRTHRRKKLMDLYMIYSVQIMNYVESLLSFKKYFPPCSELKFSACESSDNGQGWQSL